MWFCTKNWVNCSDKIWSFVQMFLIWKFSIALSLCKITNNTPNYCGKGPVVVHLSVLRPSLYHGVTTSKTALKSLRFMWVCIYIYTCMYIYWHFHNPILLLMTHHDEEMWVNANHSANLNPKGVQKRNSIHLSMCIYV